MSGNYNNRNNQQGRGSVFGTVAGTGFRLRNEKRGRDRDSDDEYFENPNRVNRTRDNRRNASSNKNNRNNNNTNRRNNQQQGSNQQRNNNNRRRTDSRHGRSSNMSASMASSRSSSVESFISSADSNPNNRSRATRSVHSRSTFSRRSFTTHSSLSAYSEGSYSDSYSDDASSYSRTTVSTRRSYSRSHGTTLTTRTGNKSTVATGTLRDGRSTLGRGDAAATAMASVPSLSGNFLSSRRSVSASVGPTRSSRRDRSAAAHSDVDHQSYGAGDSSDSAHSSRRSRSRTPVKRVDAQKLAVAAVLDATAAGGLDCLLEDPSKQPTTKRPKHGTNKQQRARSSQHRRSSHRRSVSSAAAAEDDDDTQSVHDRKEQASEYRLNVPMMQRFCTEFSAPFGFITAEAEVFQQQQQQDALGIHPKIEADEATGVPVNTKNASNAHLMASINKAVLFVLQQAPAYPSEMVRAVLWRVVQSSKGPHDRLGSWKLLDGVLRCLHRKMNAFMKVEQSLKVRESNIQQQRHTYEAEKVQRAPAADDETAEAEADADRQFYMDITAAMRLIDETRLRSRDDIRWVKTMLSELAQLLPYLVLYCWGGDKASSLRAGGTTSRAAAKRLAQQKKEAGLAAASSNGTSHASQASSAGATASNASENGDVDTSATADLEAVRRRVMDFVAGRVHGDGSMTERGQQHHSTLLRHHHMLESQAATTANVRNTISTQSRFAVGNGMHLTTSKAKPVVTEQEITVMNRQIFAEYDSILRGWAHMFASELYYVSYIHVRRAVGDYAALLHDHDAALGLRNALKDKSLSKNREGSELYHFALKASHLKQGGERSMSSQQYTDSIYYRQREVFEDFLLPPARMTDALWRFRRAEPRPSLVATVLTHYGYPIFKATEAPSTSSSTANTDAAIYDTHGAAGRRNNMSPRAEDAVCFCFPKDAAEVAAVVGHGINDRLTAWITKAAEHNGGCLACDSWTHDFNHCPYRPSRFVALSRQVVASLSAAEAIDLLKVTAGRSYADRNVAAAALAAIAGGGVSADRAGSDATALGVSLEQQGTARKQLVLDVLDAAVERAAAGVEMDTILDALDVLLRQSSSGRERQALALLASYRLQPSKMMQFTNAASNSVAPVNRRSHPGRRKQNFVDFGRSGRTANAEKLISFLNQEHRYYESARLRNAMEVLYFRYLCIPHNDAVMVQQLQRDVALIRENRCFVDVLADDEAPLQSRIFAVTPKSVLAAAIARVKRVAHLLDPCTLELSPCCAGAAVDAIRAYNAQQGNREPFEAIEPWDWFVARQVLKSERLISQHDGLSVSVDDYQSKFQRMSELIERLDELADEHDRRNDGRVAASRLRLVSHIVRQCGFCTSCNRFGHTRRTCAELAGTLIRTSLSQDARNHLGIRSITTARIAVTAMMNEMRKLQARRQRARDQTQRDEIDRDLHGMRELIGLLGGQQEQGPKSRARGPQRAPQLPPAVALIARRVGGVRSGQIDLGTTAIAPALPPAIGAAISAVLTQTGLTLAELRFCPDECLALFHAAAAHHLTPHIAAFRSTQFPNIVITSSQFEDDAFDERATQDRIAGTTVSHDLSSQTLAQLSNPSAKRRPRAYALPPEHFFQLALRYDGTGARLVASTSVLTDGLLRALNAQQLCRDRYLDLASYLMRTTGSGSVDADGVADYETVYSLLFPQSAEARVVRQQLLARGHALHDELFRRIQVRVPASASNGPIEQRPYGLIYELERDYFTRNLTADSDKASYTFVAAVQCRSNMAGRIRQYTQQRAIPAPQLQAGAASAGGITFAPSQPLSQPLSQHSSAAGSQQFQHPSQGFLPPPPPFAVGGPSPSQMMGVVVPPPPLGMLSQFSMPLTPPIPNSVGFRGRLSSGILFSQPTVAAPAAAAAADPTPLVTETMKEADAIVSSMLGDVAAESIDYNAASNTAGGAEESSSTSIVGQKRARSDNGEESELLVGGEDEQQPDVSRTRTESA